MGAKDHGSTFFDFEAVPESRNPLIATAVKTVFIILIWYTFSTCLTLYNKLLLGEHLGKFPAPLLMNTIHFSMQAIISSFLVHFWCGKTQSHIRMTWKDYFFRVVPTAVATALGIDLSNISIVFISISFATMVKSGASVFLLLFAFAFKLEVPSFKLMGIIVVISLGVMLTSNIYNSCLICLTLSTSFRPFDSIRLYYMGSTASMHVKTPSAQRVCNSRFFILLSS